MTPLEFLEFFRKNLTPLFTNGNATTFEPFVHYVAGSVDIDETAIFSNQDEDALGSWVHIHIPIGNPIDFPTRNDGTVVMSDYQKNFITNHYWFTFTTMSTLFDGSHPVAGNRQFGIMPYPGGGWQFYISGVDRMWE